MKYQLLPRLSAEEYASLERSIIAHGVLVPVEYDEAGEIIDGHHRVEICESLGLVDWPRFVRKGLSEVDKRTLSRELNFARRHLTTAQKQAVIADQLRDTPAISSRAIAAMLGVDDKTVASVRRKLVAGAEIPHLDEVEGRDGVVQPARKPIKTAFVPDHPNVGEYMKGAKIIRAEKQKLSHTVRLAHMEMVAEKGRASAPGKLSCVYPVYYADPPWRFGVRSEVTGRQKSAENHYPTLTTDEICELLVGLIGGDHPAVCFLWATNPMLLDALRVLQVCGFAYVHHWVWDKEVAGTGYWGRDRHELLLIGRRGDIAAPLPGTQPDTVYRERKGKHSAKPDWFAEQIEKLFPGVARLELFSRRARPGWDHWGFEAEAAMPETGTPDWSADPRLIEIGRKASEAVETKPKRRVRKVVAV
jgi:N6-adenosine-specific RNA methylase IME4